MSTHNLCFRAKLRKNVYPCTPHFYFIKVGCKGVQITWTCYSDGFCVHKYDICVQLLRTAKTNSEVLSNFVLSFDL